MVIVIYMFRLKSTLKQRTCSMVFLIKIHRVSRRQFSHKCSYSSLNQRSNQDMKVVWHQAIRPDGHQLFTSVKIKLGVTGKFAKLKRISTIS